MRYIEIIIAEMRLKERKHWSRDKRITCAAKMNPADLDAIDTVANHLNVTRNEFVLSAATSVAHSYIDQNDNVFNAYRVKRETTKQAKKQ